MSQTGVVKNVDPKQIKIPRGYLRLRHKLGDLGPLEKDIARNGVTNPITVIQNSRGNIELITGERRLKAAINAIKAGTKIKTVPALFKSPKLSAIDKIVLKLELDPNGEPLLPTEEAAGFQLLHEKHDQSTREISKLVNRANMTVFFRIRLLSGAPALRNAVDSGNIPTTLADKIITTYPDDFDEQEELVKKALGSAKARKEIMADLTGVQIKYAPKSIYQKPVRDLMCALKKANIGETTTDGILKHLKSSRKTDHDIELAIQAGIVKGLQIALGEKMPDPFQTTPS